MLAKKNKVPQEFFHPYMFALQEGGKINNNLMDYSLLLLHRHCSEVILSPGKPTLQKPMR